MPSKLANALATIIHKCQEMSKFTVHFRSSTYNFTQVKIKEVGMPHRVSYTVLKKLSLSLKNAIVKMALL